MTERVKLTEAVEVAEGAHMTIPNPAVEDTLIWRLRYADAGQVRHMAAAVVDSFDYLLSENITLGEAIRRLRLMRRARQALKDQDTNHE